MIFSAIIVVLIFAVTLFQANQGMFSALLMAVFAICSAALSLGTYEWVAQHWVAPYLLPDYAYAISAALLFGVPLSILHTVAAQLIRRSPLLLGMIDRIGGGICGLVTGLIVTGMLAFCLQNLPFDGSIIGFERIPLPSKEKAEGGPEPKPPAVTAQSEIWLTPDRFAVGVGALMSAGVFSGDRLLAVDEPDLVTASGWVNAAHREVSRYAPPGSISIVRNEPVSFVYDYTPPQRVGRTEEPAKFEAKPPEPGHEFHAIRVRLSNEARDQRRSHVFTLRQFRLVGTDTSTDTPVQYFPIGIQQEDASQTMNRHIRTRQTRWGMWTVVNDPMEPRNDVPNEVEVLFEVPAGFRPTFLEYKRGARAPVSFSKASSGPKPGVETAPEAPTGSAAPSEGASSAGDTGTPEGDSRRRRRTTDASESSTTGGRVRGATAIEAAAFFSEDLPFPIKSYRSVKDLDVSRGKLVQGVVFGDVAAQESGNDREISRFNVPSDKRLLQLPTERLRARSGLGRALESVTSTVQNFTVEDDRGNRYEMVGKYAIADVNGKRYFEIQYFPEVRGSIGGIGPFQEIQDSHLTGDYQLVLLFLVDPGVKITAFSTGGSASRREDLSGENIVAPE
ncbi:MAG: CvpA family protein [Phycisphaerae bacterium]|nr:CvpA family protein [Phycisphaerae bacterium]